MIIKAFPNSKYRFEFYINYEKLTWQKIKAATGCKALCNLGYYDMSKYAAAKTRAQVEASTDCGFIVGGRAIGPVKYHEWGACINSNGELVRATETGQRDYCIGLPPQYIDGQKNAAASFVAKDGCTHIGFKADGTPVILMASKDAPMTSTEANDTMLAFGCRDILRYDGSWSSQGDLGDGLTVTPSQTRIVQSYLLIYEREKQEDKPMAKKIFLDPGHGLKEACNQSPDGSYKEYLMSLDMGNRIRKHLLRSGFEVKLSREDDSTPTLTARATMANNWDADLFVSLHSNALSGGWHDDVSGLTAWISAFGGEREKAAHAILDQMKVASVPIFGLELYIGNFTVLKSTKMPAVLVEYLFHTCRSDVEKLLDPAYIEKMAVATAKGICAHFGVKYVEETPVPTPVDDEYFYRVQEGSFSTRERAEAFKKELAAMGYEGLVVPVKKETKPNTVYGEMEEIA